MARITVGATAVIGPDGTVASAAGETGTLYRTLAGATQITDVLDASDAVVSGGIVTATGDGLCPLVKPEVGTEQHCFVSFGGGPRQVLHALDLDAAIAAARPLPALAQAATQHVTSAGVDTNDGLTPGAAKKTIAAAVAALRTVGGGSIRLGKGALTVNTTIDLTELENIEIIGMGSRYTTLVLNTGPIGIDLTGTPSWRMRGLRLYTIGQPTPATVGLLLSRSVAHGTVEFSNISDVWFDMHSNMAANGGVGTIGIYNNTAEIMSAGMNVVVMADRPYVATKANIFNISSTLTTRTTVTSMSVVEITGSPTFMAFGGPAITLEGAHNFFFRGYLQGRGATPTPAAPYAVEVIGSSCSDIEIRGSFEQFTGALSTTQNIQNLQLVGRMPQSSSASMILLDGSTGGTPGIQGGRIDLLPGSGTAHALIDDGNGAGQLGVYDLDIHLYAGQSIDAPAVGFAGCTIRSDADNPTLAWVPERRGNVVLTRTFSRLTGQLLLSGASAVLTAGANNGASGPVPTKASANANRGDVDFGSGTSPSAGAQVVVTFAAVAYPTMPKVVITPSNLQTFDLGLYVSARSTTGFTVSSKNAPADSQVAGIYKFDYVVLG